MEDKIYLKKFIRDDGKTLEMDGRELYLADDNTLLVQADPSTTEIEYTEADGGEMIRQRLAINDQTINGLIVPRNENYWELYQRVSSFFQINHEYKLIYKRKSGEMFAVKDAWLSTRPQIIPHPYENYSEWSITFRVGEPFWTEYAESPSGDEIYAHSVTLSLVTANQGGEVWEEDAKLPVIGDLTYMQDFAKYDSAGIQSIVNSMVEEQVYTLKDSRDQQDYPIIKAKNGMVIMTKNLRIVGKTITPEDSDIEEGTFDIPNNQPIDFKTTSADTTANHAYLDEEHGGLYTWACATAGSGDSLSGAGQIAPHSIAPKGWKIMTYAEMQSLLTAYEIEDNANGSSKLRGIPLNFEYGQYAAMTSGTIYHGMDEGMYWYSDVTSSTQANSLDIIASRVYSKPNNRPYGFSVRCILRTGGGSMRPIIEQLTYMQDVTICDFDILAASMEPEKVYTLIDRRNSVQYKIALLKDGNIWMLDDLRIANYRCTPEDTDITEGSFQIPESTSGNYPGGSTAETIAVRVEENAAYYSWAAATAGCKPADGAALISIMPKGWTLPTGADFEKLIHFYPTKENVMAEPVPSIKPVSYWTSNNGVAPASMEDVYRWASTIAEDGNPDLFVAAKAAPYVRGQTVLANGFAIRGIVRRKEE